ncbi:MAG: tryptophan halogenase family protein [Pseudomonadota bacterium]
MSEAQARSIVIVGGGTGGWMTAAALARLAPKSWRIRLVESDEIATIGVGEATIPPIKEFNQALKLDEDDFLRATKGTFKLGIEFVNWGGLGERYIHGFGTIGKDLGALSCFQYWLRQQLSGRTTDLCDYSINTAACRQNKFMRKRADMGDSPLGSIANAFHFDASLYAQYLRKFAEGRGVVRTEGKVVDVKLRSDDGFITAVVLASGEQVEADFFIDCTGIRALLIGQTLKEPYEDWSHWLPCNRAIAVPCESAGPLLPYTRATAHTAGWQWRIPLQHRIGNGHVFSSEFMSEDEATSILLKNLDGEPLAEPRTIPFVPGRRRKTWVKNCVAIGLSSGFFEPIESTNIHLIHTAVHRIITLFPTLGFNAADIAEYNRQTQFEYERIRDFIVLHYKATSRRDSPFWDHCRNLAIPETLQHKIDLFRSSGRVFREGAELFGEVSWIQVMLGQGIVPTSYHPLADTLTEAELATYLDDVKNVVGKCVNVMPTHEQFVAHHCAMPA